MPNLALTAAKNRPVTRQEQGVMRRSRRDDREARLARTWAVAAVAGAAAASVGRAGPLQRSAQLVAVSRPAPALRRLRRELRRVGREGEHLSRQKLVAVRAVPQS